MMNRIGKSLKISRSFKGIFHHKNTLSVLKNSLKSHFSTSINSEPPVEPETRLDVTLPSEEVPAIPDIKSYLEERDECYDRGDIFTFLMAGNHKIDQPMEDPNVTSLINPMLEELKKEDTLKVKVDYVNNLFKLSAPQALYESAINHVMETAALKGRTDLIKNIILELGMYGISPKNEHYVWLMKCLRLNHRMEDCHKVLEMVKANGQKPSPKMYIELMVGYTNQRDSENAWRVYYSLKEDGVKETEEVLARALRICYLDCDVRKAFSLIDQFELAGNALGKSIYDEAIRIGGSRVHLDEHASTKAFEMFKKMLANRIQPDGMTFKNLIHATRHLRDLDLSYRILDLAVEKKIKITAPHLMEIMRCIRESLISQEVTAFGIRLSADTRVAMIIDLMRQLQKYEFAEFNVKFKAQRELFFVYKNTSQYSKMIKTLKRIIANKGKVFRTEYMFSIALRTILNGKPKDCAEGILYCSKNIEHLSSYFDEMQRARLIRYLTRTENKAIVAEIIQNFEKIGVTFNELELDYIYNRIDAKKSLAFEYELTRNMSKLRYEKIVGGGPLPNDRERRDFLRWKAGLSRSNDVLADVRKK